VTTQTQVKACKEQLTSLWQTHSKTNKINACHGAVPNPSSLAPTLRGISTGTTDFRPIFADVAPCPQVREDSVNWQGPNQM
jgi:hypothetical protein